MIYETELAKALAIENMSVEEVALMFETPKDPKMGDTALPCFKFSRAMRKAPAAIASELAPRLASLPFVESAQAVNGYLNIRFNRATMAKEMASLLDKEKICASDEGKGKTVCIDYSSVNIAKPFHIGHLSTTVIGGALYRIFGVLGYNVVGINHLGDWGTQFGKLIVATKKWSTLEEVAEKGVEFLNTLYVRFHKEVASEPALEDEARAWFKRIEDGDDEAHRYFDVFKRITLEEVGKIYKRLKIKFDSYNGESFYNDKMKPCLDELRGKNLLVRSEGAEVVKLDDYDMPPCVLVKADGATLYATRDIAAAYYRAKTYDFYKCLYVVAYQQNLHFKQLFKVLELMGFEKYADCEHIAFGMVSLEDGAMSTREGRVVWLKDVLDRAVEKAKTIINEKNPDAPDKDAIAESVGVGAVVFSALFNNRIKDITFSFDKVLNFDGETAPYIQYTYARCKSVLRKSGTENLNIDSADFSVLADDESYEAVKSILSFAESVKTAAKLREPCVVTRHIIDLAEKYNRFYIDRRILNAEKNEREARLLLTAATAKVLAEGLALLGIDSPESM